MMPRHEGFWYPRCANLALRLHLHDENRPHDEREMNTSGVGPCVGELGENGPPGDMCYQPFRGTACKRVERTTLGRYDSHGKQLWTLVMRLLSSAIVCKSVLARILSHTKELL